MIDSYFSRSEVIKHAIVTPLTTILLNTEMALQIQAETEINYQYYLKKVLLSAKYLSSILGLSESNDTTSSFAIFPAINEVITIGCNKSNKVEIILHIGHLKNKRIFGSKLLFQESLICLLNNAAESYSESTLKKIIYITASINKKDKIITLSITDGGSGMTLGEKKQAIEYGTTYKQNHSGIGLNFVNEVITKQCKGCMVIQSRKHHGTTIKLILHNVSDTIPSSIGVNYSIPITSSSFEK